MSHVTLVQTKPGEFEFRMPDIGEGVVEGEIVKWLVKEGDTVEEDQPIVEIMTDKATVEIPSPKSGVILKRFFAEGAVCPVGGAMVLIGAESGGEEAPHAAAPMEVPAALAAPHLQAGAPGLVLSAAAPGQKALAAPATRKLARDLGLDINQVQGSGPHGRVIREDLQGTEIGHAAPVASAPSRAKAAPQAVAVTGDVERFPLRGLRRKIAEKMVQSAFTAPHVTTFDEVDMTALVALRARLKPMAEASGVKLSYMPFIMKAVMAALKRYPFFNASLDESTQEIVVKKYVHMGFAASTDHGLMVPVIKNAHEKSILALGKDMADIAERARAGKAPLDELTGSTFTISNVGSIGGLFATPIINYPEVAILGINKIEKRAVVRNGEIVIRDMMYIGLSFDHRVIDGSDAVIFLNAVIAVMQDPDILLLEG